MICKNGEFVWGLTESDCAKDDCPYHANGVCRLKEMEDIAEKIRELFPNVQCDVEDGSLQIWFDIIANAENCGPFKEAGAVLLSPKNGGAAKVIADIMDYDDPTKNEVRTSSGQHPVQHYMINPEMVTW